MPDVPELRRAVESAAERFGKVAVASGARVSRDTLYRFLNGDDLSPPKRARLAEYVGRVRSGSVGQHAGGEASGPGVGPPGAANWRDLALYMSGVLDASISTLRGVSQTVAGLEESLRGARGLLDNATDGVAQLARSGLLPRAPIMAPLPAGWHIAPLREPTPEEEAEAARIEAEMDAELAAEARAAAAQRTGGRRRRAAGE